MNYLELRSEYKRIDMAVRLMGADMIELANPSADDEGFFERASSIIDRTVEKLTEDIQSEMDAQIEKASARGVDLHKCIALSKLLDNAMSIPHSHQHDKQMLQISQRELTEFINTVGVNDGYTTLNHYENAREVLFMYFSAMKEDVLLSFKNDNRSLLKRIE